jgi:hypothetical protein
MTKVLSTGPINYGGVSRQVQYPILELTKPRKPILLQYVQ